MRGVLSRHRPDVVACGILIAVPTLLFVIPTLLGHPPIVADNLIQNYPLRVLSGKILATGHLPEWNRLANSGTPLLGGLNAGALYPLTLPFAVLPGIVAWIINMVACYVAAGLGVYALARWLGLAPVPAFLGAISYAFMGMMVGQMVHLGVIQGQGWLPWVVLAMLVITRRIRTAEPAAGLGQRLSGALWPLLGLVVLVALVFLTGEPRSIADLEVVGFVTLVYCVFWADRGPGPAHRVLVALSIGAASIWGVMLAAIQLLPGESFIALSQRASLTESFFGSGSFALQRTVLLGIPDFFGGAGLLRQPSFFIDYNLPELSGYVGLFGLVALFAAFSQLFGTRRRERPAWLAFFVALGLVGLLLAWGQFTPFIHVMAQIPLLNKTRLQSRNLAIFDLAVSVLVAWFADRIFSGDFAHASLTGRRRYVTAAPLLVTALVALGAMAWPGGILEVFGASASQAAEGHFLLIWYGVSLMLVLLAVGYLWRCARWSPQGRKAALVAFIVLDSAVFMVSSATGLVSAAGTAEPSAAYAASVLGTQGRFALIDPNLTHLAETVALGQPNTNVFTGLSSVQGYGSLIGNSYGTATGAHNQNYLDPCGLTDGTYRQLRLSSLVVASDQLAPIISLPGQAPFPAVAAPVCPNETPVTKGLVRPFYFGAALTLTTLTLEARSETTSLPLHVEIIDPSGTTRVVRAVVTRLPRSWRVDLPTHPVAVGVVIAGPVHQVLESSTITDAAGLVYALDGPFQNALDRSGWALRGTSGTLQTFWATAGLVSPIVVSGAGQGSTATRLESTIWGSETDSVHLVHAGTVVRSEAYLPGWRVTVTPSSGGASKVVTVSQHGLVQSVSLPAGSWRLSWSYRAPRLALGMAISAVGGVALIGVVGFDLLRRTRRRRAGTTRER